MRPGVWGPKIAKSYDPKRYDSPCRVQPVASEFDPVMKLLLVSHAQRVRAYRYLSNCAGCLGDKRACAYQAQRGASVLHITCYSEFPLH
jgi:hypothetical protein